MAVVSSTSSRAIVLDFVNLRQFVKDETVSAQITKVGVISWGYHRLDH